MLIKVLLLFFYCFSSKSILLSLAPFSLEQAIKINFENKRKHSDSANEERKENKDFDFKKKRKKSSQSQKNPKKYKCDECNKKLSRKRDLLSHKRTHTGEKPYECDECNKKFARLDALGVHKRTHTGVKPYPCDGCDKKFNVLSNLKVHKRTHTGEKPYPCDECDKRFTEIRNLKQHKTTSHNKKHDLPQEETQAGQEANSTRMEAPSEWNVHNIAESFYPSYQGAFFSFEDSDMEDISDEDLKEYFDPSYQGELFPVEASDNRKHDLPQEETQAGQEANSTRMEAPSELSCWFCISDRTYSTNSNLNHHTRKQHAYYKCKYKNCDKAFILGSVLFQHIEKKHGLPSLPCSKCPQSFHGLLNLYQHKYIKHKKYDKNTFIEFLKDFIIKNLRSSYPSDGQHPFFKALFSKGEVLIDILLDLETIDISEIPRETLPLYEEFIKKITSNKIPKFDKLSLDELLSYECYRLYLFDDSAIWLLLLKDILSIMIRIKNSLRNPLETTYKEMLDILYTKDTNQFSDEEYFLFMQTFKNLFFKNEISTSEQIKMVELNSLNKSA